MSQLEAAAAAAAPSRIPLSPLTLNSTFPFSPARSDPPGAPTKKRGRRPEDEDEDEEDEEEEVGVVAVSQPFDFLGTTLGIFRFT